jgi:hypothetical protein
MTPQRRFLLGGGGALMPVLISLLAIDLGALLDSESNLTTGNIIGFGIRYLVLFIVGGVVAYLHEDETKSFKLFELGIVAPALITSLITAQGVAAAGQNSFIISSIPINMSLISSANAETLPRIAESNQDVAWSFSDVLDGLSGRVYQKISKAEKKVPERSVDSQTQEKDMEQKESVPEEDADSEG